MNRIFFCEGMNEKEHILSWKYRNSCQNYGRLVLVFKLKLIIIVVGYYDL